ncbi:MAG TPA: MFS transporter, partial [Actinomycetota bacterium]|nr:MFS transporter [Actinomycetota bacterium]
MRALLSNGNFRRLWIGQTLSALGDYAMFLVLAVWAKDLTGSNAAAGLTFLPFALPSLFGPVLGVYVDRFPRRRVMILTDVACALVMLTLLGVHDRSQMWLIYLVSFLYGICVVIYQAARSGLLVGMLQEAELGDANGLLQSSQQAMRLVAPLAGAGLYTLVGGAAVAVVDAGTFLISAAFLLSVHSRDLDRAGGGEFLTELKAGLRHIAHTTELRRLTIGTALVTLSVGMSEVFIFAAIDQGLHRAPAFLGVLSSIEGVGSVAAGLIVGLTMRRIGEMRTAAIAAAAAGIGLGLFATAMLGVIFVASVAIGVAITFFNVAYVTLMQRRTSLEMQGRVMSAVEAVVTFPYLVSFLIGAAIVSVVDFRVIYLAEGVCLLAIGAYFAIQRT